MISRRLILALSVSALGGAVLSQAQTMPSPAGNSAVNDLAVSETPLPRALSDFAFFSDPAGQVPNKRVIPYRLNTPLFSDGAEKLRFIYLPAGMTAKADGEGLMNLPVGAAIIKTFAFGDGEGRRLIETRVLLHRSDGWLALPYKWNDDQSDARLVVAGARIDLTTPSGEEISYRVPNKNQCKECHGLQGEVIPIGPKARNLSQEWLEGLNVEGKLDAMPGGSDLLPKWELRDTVQTALAARAYLDVNCAHCHRPGATASNSGLDLRWEQDNLQAIGIGKRPVAAGRGSGGMLFDIVPGKPDQSILVHRMRSNETGVAMPELGKSTIDQDGVRVIERWIAEME